MNKKALKQSIKAMIWDVLKELDSPEDTVMSLAVQPCGCGCEDGGIKMIKPGEYSDGMQYHIDNKIPLSEIVYRPLSKEYFNLINEARRLYNEGVIDMCDKDKWIVNSDLGKKGMYQDIAVPLDYMFSPEDVVSEEKAPALNKPHRGGTKKFYVFVKDPKTKRIKKVSFGMAGGGLRAKLNNPKARTAFSKRMNCPAATDKTKPKYWACRLPRYAKLLGFKTSFTGFW
jgi:hypothetical protein